MLKPELSIIVPVYNAEAHLEKCVLSILTQTYTNFEMILVDDGSIDHSRILCEKLKKSDKRIKAIYKENGGASSARNIGLKSANGDYIGFVDSDDYVSKDMFQHLMELAKKEQADIAICEYTNKIKKLKKQIKFKLRVIDNKNELMRYFFRLNKEKSNYSVWNRVYKSSCLKEICFLEGKITEDVYFTYQTYKNASKVVISNQIKYLYDLKNSGITAKEISKRDLDLLYIWDRIVDEEENSMYFEAAQINRKRAVFTLYSKSILYGRNPEITEELLNTWKYELRKSHKDLVVLLDWKRRLLLFCICNNII